MVAANKTTVSEREEPVVAIGMRKIKGGYAVFLLRVIGEDVVDREVLSGDAPVTKARALDELKLALVRKIWDLS